MWYFNLFRNGNDRWHEEEEVREGEREGIYEGRGTMSSLSHYESFSRVFPV